MSDHVIVGFIILVISIFYFVGIIFIPKIITWIIYAKSKDPIKHHLSKSDYKVYYDSQKRYKMDNKNNM